MKVIMGILVAGATLGFGAPAAFHASRQGSRTTPTAVPATVAITDGKPFKGVDAVIIRRADVSPHDLILIARGVVSAEYVAASLHALAVTRARHGDAPENRVVRVDIPKRKLKKPETPMLILALLRAGAPRNISGFGMLSAVDVNLAPQVSH